MDRWRTAWTLIAFVAGSTARAQPFEWTNPAGGAWNTDTNWSPVGHPGVAGQSALISLAGSYTVSTVTSIKLDSLQVLNPTAILNVNFNTGIEVLTSADFINNGLVVINPSNLTNTYASMWFKADLNVGGSGTLRLNAAGYSGEATLSFAVMNHLAPHKITGKGMLGGNVINNESLIHSNSGGEILIRSIIHNGPGGEIRSSSGSMVTLVVETEVYGGLISGAYTSLGHPLLSGVTNTARCVGMFRLPSAGIVNNGTIEIRHLSAAQKYGVTVLEPATISGTGKVTLMALSDLDQAQIYTANGSTLTNGPLHLINGTGRIYAPMINQGTINADVDDKLIEIRSAITQQGSGIITADKGDACLAAGAFITGGRFGSVNGGRVRATGSSTISGVTNIGTLAIDPGIVLTVQSPTFENNGTIILNTTASTGISRLLFNQSSTMNGTGTLLMNAGSDSGRARLTTTAPAVLTLGPGQTVRGTGLFYANLISSGKLSPGAIDGAISTLSPREPLTLTSQSQIVIDAVGISSNQYDKIASSEPMTIAGSVSLVISGGWAPTASCTSVNFLSALTLTGKFDSYSVSAPPTPGKVWRLYYKPNGVSFRLTCPADFNADCEIDDADFVGFASGYDLLLCSSPEMPQYCPADLNNDSFVDDADFVLFVAAYSQLVCP
ncbi:MAG: hypothetical protein J0L78_04710 [Planctomycetes bacterium]|nr:hypothetical protein [Planctomycetota bacterium]